MKALPCRYPGSTSAVRNDVFFGLRHSLVGLTGVIWNGNAYASNVAFRFGGFPVSARDRVPLARRSLPVEAVA